MVVEIFIRLRPGLDIRGLVGNIHFCVARSRNSSSLAVSLRAAGAAVDVLSCEPPQPDNPPLSAPNCLVTPHIAWATKEARSRLMKIAVENLNAFLNGKTQNVVNP